MGRWAHDGFAQHVVRKQAASPLHSISRHVSHLMLHSGNVWQDGFQQPEEEERQRARSHARGRNYVVEYVSRTMRESQRVSYVHAWCGYQQELTLHHTSHVYRNLQCCNTYILFESTWHLPCTRSPCTPCTPRWHSHWPTPRRQQTRGQTREQKLVQRHGHWLTRGHWQRQRRRQQRKRRRVRLLRR